MDSYPKVSTNIEVEILKKVSSKMLMAMYFVKDSECCLYHTRKLRYFLQFLDCAPIIYNEDGSIRETSELKEIGFASKDVRDSAIAVYLSTLFFWFFITYSDCRNLNKREVDAFPCGLDDVADNALARLGRRMLANLQKNS